MKASRKLMKVNRRRPTSHPHESDYMKSAAGFFCLQQKYVKSDVENS